MSHWKVLSTKSIFDGTYIKVKSEQVELPDGRVMDQYFVVDFVDWVNVVAITEAGQMIMVYQSRHAVREHFLELPGGTTSSDGIEDPKLAGLRELQEETGYSSDDVEYIGHHYPNPALQSNRMHIYLAKNCIKVSDQNLDPFEELEVRLMAPEDVYAQCDQGQIGHSLMMASLAMCRSRLIEQGIIKHSSV